MVPLHLEQVRAAVREAQEAFGRPVNSTEILPYFRVGGAGSVGGKIKAIFECMNHEIRHGRAIDDPEPLSGIPRFKITEEE